MKPPAHTLRAPLASATLSARLLHTLFVLIATSLSLSIAIFAFLLVLLLKFTTIAPPAPAASRRAERHVKFLEPSIVITLPSTPTQSSSSSGGGDGGSSGGSSPARVPTPTTLSLTATPRELEPATPDVAEEPLRALARICGFLAANSARAWRRDELAATPPLAGLEPYLAAVQEDLARCEEMAEEEEDGEDEGEGEGAVADAAAAGEVRVWDRESAGVDPEAGAGEVAGAGAGVSAADAYDEPGLVPDQTTHATTPPLSAPSPFPTPTPGPDTSASALTATSTPPPPPDPIAKASPEQTNTSTATPSTSTSTTTPPTPPPPTTPSNPRKRKDAVLSTNPRPIAALGNLLAAAPGTTATSATSAATTAPADADADADKLADSPDMRGTAPGALFSRVADLGAELFEGTVRERGAALWAAISRSRGRSSPPDVPLPLPRTRFATGAAERR